MTAALIGLSIVAVYLVIRMTIWLPKPWPSHLDKRIPGLDDK